MADQSITQLPNLAAPDITDVVVLVDDTAGVPTTKKATLGSLPISTATQTALDGKAAALGADDNYVTDAEKTKLANLSGTNTGDQDLTNYFIKTVDDTDDIPVGTTNKFATAAEKTKLGFITVTQNVDLDAMESAGATNLGYTAATRVLTSDTGTDVTLPLVSSGDAGLAPASGGGTTNFLRADGTWHAPTASIAYTLVATLASDQATGPNTSPISLTGLSFSYEANSTYRIWMMGRVVPGVNTTGCGFQFDLSSAVTSINFLFHHQLANSGSLSGGHSVADDASVGVSSGFPATSTYPVSGSGLLITTGNTGTAQLRFRSETTAAVTAKAGLTLVVEKIA